MSVAAFDGNIRTQQVISPNLSRLFPDFGSLSLSGIDRLDALSGTVGTDVELIKGDKNQVVRKNVVIQVDRDRKQTVSQNVTIQTGGNKKETTTGNSDATTIGSTHEFCIGSINRIFSSEENITHAAPRNRQQPTSDSSFIAKRTTNALSDASSGMQSSDKYLNKTVSGGVCTVEFGAYSSTSGVYNAKAGVWTEIAGLRTNTAATLTTTAPIVINAGAQVLHTVASTTLAGIILGPNQII